MHTKNIKLQCLKKNVTSVLQSTILLFILSVIKETLENRGSLGQIKARIRAEVFSALDDQSEVKPPLSNENMIINELIREYLDFNKYKYSSSVLVAGNLKFNLLLES